MYWLSLFAFVQFQLDFIEEGWVILSSTVVKKFIFYLFILTGFIKSIKFHCHWDMFLFLCFLFCSISERKSTLLRCLVKLIRPEVGKSPMICDSFCLIIPLCLYAMGTAQGVRSRQTYSVISCFAFNSWKLFLEHKQTTKGSELLNNPDAKECTCRRHNDQSVLSITKGNQKMSLHIPSGGLSCS